VKLKFLNRSATVGFYLLGAASTSTLAAERYDLMFADASYSSPNQRQLNYSSFVGDRETGAIYSCAGKVILHQNSGNIMSHTESCVEAYLAPSGSRSEYTFNRISSLDATVSANAPRMNPAWGFWRLDQTRHLHAFCLRYGYPTVMWTCFEAPLPQP
jgi:hypothetical protein